MADELLNHINGKWDMNAVIYTANYSVGFSASLPTLSSTAESLLGSARRKTLIQYFAPVP